MLKVTYFFPYVTEQREEQSKKTYPQDRKLSKKHKKTDRFLQRNIHVKSEEVTKITWSKHQKGHVINYLENTG